MGRHDEPDRAALRHRSRPDPHQGRAAGDGSYKITGQKIWISGGEQDLTENIIHLVLARIEGAPEGIKGISLFVVPKFLVNDDGSLGARNGQLRRPRREDGHPRQRDLRDEL
jgi:alkylation response protein AidB-like acyl-CoA dehydrogenase